MGAQSSWHLTPGPFPCTVRSHNMNDSKPFSLTANQGAEAAWSRTAQATSQYESLTVNNKGPEKSYNNNKPCWTFACWNISRLWLWKFSPENRYLTSFRTSILGIIDGKNCVKSSEFWFKFPLCLIFCKFSHMEDKDAMTNSCHLQL
jgi:hypothetical protein